MPPLSHRILLTVLAVASFFATAAIVRSALPPPDEFEGADKLAFLREHPDRYNALIIGSSAVFRGLDPNVIDPLVQRTEPSFESFNLAARGMRAYESDALLREALDICGDSIRWVLVEVQGWTPQVETSAVDTQRDLDWHGIAHTRMVLAASRDPYYPEEERAEWTEYHAKRFFYRLGNYGESERLWIALGGDEYTPYVTAEQLERGHGYVSIEESLGKWWTARNEKFLENVPAYEKSVAALEKGTRSTMPDSAVALHVAQTEYLEERGLEVIHVMPPFARGGLFIEYFEEEGLTPKLLNFLQPKVYPQLYEVDARLDKQHLKEEAAAELSRLAGEQLAELLAPAGRDAERKGGDDQ